MDMTEEDMIEEYLDRYGDTQGMMPSFLEEYGELYREQGHLTREQLYEIAYESSTRSAYHVRTNPRERCRQVTANVRDLADDFSQIALISALQGFKAPTASCVLTALDPERHAVVDTRVWTSLERIGRLEGRKESFDATDYVAMIDAIRDLADETGFSTAEVGYALFAYDVDARDGTLH